MKVTIITINYNNKTGLGKTLRSVRSQNTRDFEYIVVDGGSNDGSRELILENADIIDRWVSERDRGIYNAMNKGVAMASGEYCLFLNSGDTLHSSDVMGKIVSMEMGADIVFGMVENVYPDGKIKTYVPSEEISLLLIAQTGLHHAGSFILTDLMRRHPYDETLKICSDRKFFIEALVIDNCSFSNLNFVVCDFELGGVSFTNTGKAWEESCMIMNELFPPRLVADYRKTNLTIQNMSSRLIKTRQRIISIVCRMDLIILKILNVLLGKRMYRQ